ncbi:MAG: tRNA (N(6)-L-threonylcarbamoyladenosine(37)-C(2))-methylthiotransferase MtaB [Candidatus Acidiferrales bacterium]
MPTFTIENFGCRATQADAASIENHLLTRGFLKAASHAAADVIVLNTCTVTAAADSQARDSIRHIKRANPAAQIVVTGCYAQRAPEELAALEGVSWVVGNSHQAEIPQLLERTAALPSRPMAGAHELIPLSQLEIEPLSLARGPAKILTGDIFAQTEVIVAPIANGDAERTRPTLKIQDGCNNRCSYCVIPFVRGGSRSLAPSRVFQEIRSLVNSGYKEIVLSGINLGSYGRDLTPRVELGELLCSILEQTALEQLRLSSIEPLDVTQDLIDLIASSDRLAQHFHMPLQSGSDRILRAMRRWYRAAHYARRVELIHERLPEAAIGADVIVGFPGETDEDFRATCDFIAQSPFSYLHVFSFSARPGTEAAKLSEEIPLPVIKQRARELRSLSAAKAAAFRAAQSGRVLRALTLHKQGAGWTEALTGNYLKLRIPGLHPANQWIESAVTADVLPAI